MLSFLAGVCRPLPKDLFIRIDFDRVLPIRSILGTDEFRCKKQEMEAAWT